MNHLSNTDTDTNSHTANVVLEIEYDEYGNVLKQTRNFEQPFAFAGGIYDEQTKLTRFGARDYDSEVGRWTAKDPIGFLGSPDNLYAYVSNNPVNFIDPTGLWWPPTHFSITYNVAKSLGYSEEAANQIAYYSGWPSDAGDFQGTNWEDAVRHGMSGTENGKYQSTDQAMMNTLKFITDQINKAQDAQKKGNCNEYYENLGYAMHAAQDIYAPLHNFAPWLNNSGDSWAHLTSEFPLLSSNKARLNNARSYSNIILRVVK